MPVALPKGVEVQITADQITVKGANGTLVRAVHALVQVQSDAGVL
jgi:large subunit ribosomal protein L6